MTSSRGQLNKLLKCHKFFNQFQRSVTNHAENARVLDLEVCKGQGVRLWDKNGKEYLDFIGGQGSVNAGHSHPKLIGAMQDQMCILHQTTRSLNNNILPEFCQTICQMFNYDKVLVMSTGVEACETAVKLARIWGYKVKKICPKDALVVFCTNNYWGCSISAISASSDPLLFGGFQPLLPGLKLIPYDDPCSLEEVLKNPNVCGFMMEPIQGDYGVIVPNEGYLAEVRRLCTQNKVLWICDEVLTGLGRTGAMLGVDYECVKPDILVLGKSLAGGMYPVSATLASCEIMDLLKPGSHHSTFAGNPLGARVASTMLKLIKEDGLAENACAMGALLRDGLLCTFSKDDMPVLRGRGLLWACKIDPRIGSPCDICDQLRDCGLLVWPCRDEFIRFTPPLILTEEEVTQAISIFKKKYKKERMMKNNEVIFVMVFVSSPEELQKLINMDKFNFCFGPSVCKNAINILYWHSPIYVQGIGSPCDICDQLRDCGLLMWPCRDEFIRMTPPLTLTEEDVTQAISIFNKVIGFMKGCGRVC